MIDELGLDGGAEFAGGRLVVDDLADDSDQEEAYVLLDKGAYLREPCGCGVIECLHGERCGAFEDSQITVIDGLFEETHRTRN